MSFLAGRLAATEGAFFSQTSKQAMARLKDKLNNAQPPQPSSSSSSPQQFVSLEQADVLPEILQHTPPPLSPSSAPAPFSPPPSSLAASLTSPCPSLPPSSLPLSQSVLSHTGGPLAFFASVPQTSFGPKRWKPNSDEVKISASTANEARMDDISSVDVARAKALMEGYSTVLKAFFVATTLVVGGITVLAAVAGSRLQINSIDDVRAKGHEYMQPRAEAIRQQFEPWKRWMQQRSREWHMDENQYKDSGAIFAKSLGWKQSLGQSKEER